MKSAVNFFKLAKCAVQGLTRRLTLANLIVRVALFLTGLSSQSS